MSYIGHNPTNAGSFYILDDITLGNSAGPYNLTVAGVSVTPKIDNLLIALDGVLQHAEDAYTISGNQITFDAAPGSGVDFYGVIMGQSASFAQGSIGADELRVDGDGTSLQVLASDGDGTFSWISQSALTPSANLVTGATLKSTVTASSLTSVGTLTGLTTGAITQNAGVFTIKNASSDGNGLRIFQDSSDASKIYNHYNGTLQLGVGNTTALTIDSSERVGIGISSSITDPLHVKTTAVETRISLESSTGKWAIGAEDGDKFGILNYGTSTPFIIDSSGNIGIGQATPQTDNSTATFLHIGGSGDASSGLVLEDNEAQWEIQNNGHLRIKRGSTDVVEFDSGSGKATFAGDVTIGNDLKSSGTGRFIIEPTSGTSDFEALRIKNDTHQAYISLYRGGTERGRISTNSNALYLQARNGGSAKLLDDGGNGLSIADGGNATFTGGVTTSINSGTSYSTSAELTASNGMYIYNSNGSDNTGDNNFATLRFGVASGAQSVGWLVYQRNGNNSGAFHFQQRTGASSYAKTHTFSNNGGLTAEGHIASQNFSSMTQFNGNMNDLKKPGFYRIENTASNAPNSNYWSCIVFGNGDNVTGQLVGHFQGTGSAYWRGFNNSWSSWHEIEN